MALLKWEVSDQSLGTKEFLARTRDDAKRQFWVWARSMIVRLDDSGNDVEIGRHQFESEFDLKTKKFGRA